MPRARPSPAIEAQGAFLATVEQPWPSILDMLMEHVLAYQEDGTMPDSNFEAVGTTLVTIDNASSITPSDQLE